MTVPQGLPVQFPTKVNRENILKNREILDGNREFDLHHRARIDRRKSLIRQPSVTIDSSELCPLPPTAAIGSSFHISAAKEKSTATVLTQEQVASTQRILLQSET